MELRKDVPTIQQQPIHQQMEAKLSADEIKRLADFFSILIQIDRREKVTNAYEKST